MKRERFWKPVIPEDADGRWVYILTLRGSGGHEGFDVQALRYLFGFDGLGVEIEELSCDHFQDLDAAERDCAEKRRQLAENGYTESEVEA